MDDQMKEEYENCAQTFGLMKEMCEGHNKIAQDLLREQPTHAGDISLVQLCIDLLFTQCRDTSIIKRMQEEQVELLNSNLEVLVEMTQGPCEGNQELIANSEAIQVFMWVCVLQGACAYVCAYLFMWCVRALACALPRVCV